MKKLSYASNFRDLLAYQLSRQLARDVYEITKSFPREEMYSLTDQIRRSSRSIGAQIAEAWGKRRYERHFISKLTDADGEQLETQHWIDIAFDCDYITDARANDLLSRCERIGKLLGGMIAKSNQFCISNDTVLRESTAEYFT